MSPPKANRGVRTPMLFRELRGNSVNCRIPQEHSLRAPKLDVELIRIDG